MSHVRESPFLGSRLALDGGSAMLYEQRGRRSAAGPGYSRRAQYGISDDYNFKARKLPPSTVSG